MKDRNLDDCFRAHAVNEVQQSGMQFVRNECETLAIIIADNVPACEEKEVAIVKLQEVMMWANAGIARERV